MHGTQLIMVRLKIRPYRKPKFAKIATISRLAACFKNYCWVCKFVKVAIAAKNLQP